MLRTSLIRATQAITTQRAAFSTSRAVMGAGDTGGVRSGGEKTGDAFTRRERGSEEMWIKEQERAKLRELQEKLSQQRKHIDELSKNIDEIFKNSGGEHN